MKIPPCVPAFPLYIAPAMQRSLIALRIILLCFALSGLASAGDIFVYKGPVITRSSLAISNVIPRLARVYIVIDFDTGESRSIIYVNKDGKRQGGGETPFNVTRAALPNAKPLTVIGYGNHNETSVNQFNFQSVVLKGVDVSLKVETDPLPRIVIRPRVFTGTGVGMGSDLGTDGRFQISNYTAVLQSALTIDANNNNKTVETVAGEISAALLAQGYELP
jgi:hypothetical protein